MLSFQSLALCLAGHRHVLEAALGAWLADAPFGRGYTALFASRGFRGGA